MNRDFSFDFRFYTESKKKEKLEEIILALTVDDLKLVIKAAEKLEIEDYKTRPSVDVLYDIACALSILEAEIVSPNSIMDKIKEYLEKNN